MFAGLLLFAHPLLSLFGSTYSKGASALAILAAGQLFNAATGPLGQMINMSGRPYLTLVNNATVAALNIGACLVLIPRYGVTGAACSTTGAITLVNLIKLVQVRIIFGLNPFTVRAVRAVGAVLLAVGLSAPIVFLPHWSSSAVEIVVAGLVLVVAYCSFFWFLAANIEERGQIRRRIRGARGPAAAPASA